MPGIHITTFIAAPLERVFELYRNLAVFRVVFLSGKEKFSAVSSNDILQNDETVTILSRLAGRGLSLKLRFAFASDRLTITFEQISGSLKYFRYQQFFKPVDNGTIVIEKIEYGYPKNFFQSVAARFSLKEYLQNFFDHRNSVINELVVSGKWKEYFDQ